MTTRPRRRPFDVCGPLPTGVDRARGERRHRQDVHDRRARRALRRRGHAARASCCSSRSRAWRPASCASACASGSSAPSTASSRVLAGAPTPEDDAVRRAARDGRAGGGASCGATGSRRRSPTSTRRRSSRPTASARRSSAGSASPATSSPTSTFVEDVARPRRRGRRRPLRPPLPPREDDAAVRPRAGARDRAARGRQPGGADRARRRRRRRRPGDARAGSPQAVREELERRKRRGALMTYDDLLTRLDDDAAAATAATRSRDACATRYRVVLVDEFQDTDPVQWSIMRRAFGEGGGDARAHRRPETGDLRLPRRRRLRLPRGRASDRRRRPTLERQLAQRPGPDRRLRRALRRREARPRGDRLPHGPRGRRQPARRGCAARPTRAPLRVRVVHRDDPALRTIGGGQRIQVDSAREHVAAGPRRRRRRAAVDVGARRSRASAIQPGPRRRARAHATRPPRSSATSSTRVGVPAVINGAGSVFGDRAAARDWLRLLEALERPTSTPRARAAALTAVPRLEHRARSPSAADDEWEEVHQRLHRWARVLRVKGVAVADRGDHADRAPARARAARRPAASGG